MTGHFFLFALLGFAVISWASRPTRASTRSTRVQTTAVLAILVTLEELSQSLLSTRTFSLLDLSASLAGLLVGAWLVGRWPASGAAR